MATERKQIESGWSVNNNVPAASAMTVLVTNTNGGPLYYAITDGALPDFNPDLAHYVEGTGQFSLQLQADEVLCLSLNNGSGAVTITTGAA